MKQLVFDIETDGLLDECTEVFVLIAQDIQTGTTYTFTDYDDKYPSLSDGFGFLNMADALIGHNIIGFDLPALKMLYGWEPLDRIKFYDTWIISQVCSYKRAHKQGLAGWGEKFNYPKIEFDDFSKYSDEMRVYCERDVNLNTKVYLHLLTEIRINAERNPLFKEGLRIEHDISKFNAFTRDRGWRFDVESACGLVSSLEKLMKDIEDEIEPNLPEITRLIDKEPKEPKYTKAGLYTAPTVRMLSEFYGREIRPTEAKSDNPPIKPGESFQRTEVVKATLGNMDSVKDYLLSIGWVPDDHNVKRVGNQWVTTGPKLTTTSLEKLGEVGVKIDTYYTLRNRKSVVEGWLDLVDSDGRLHGNLWTIGTPTFRARHEVIANLPSCDVPYGSDIRGLFIPEDDWVVVGADSSGNQFRSLCHYVKDDKLTEQVLSGDIHQFNADLIGTDRRTAKTWIYAFLFGAGNAKLGKILTGTNNAQAGQTSRDKYAERIPGLKRLQDNIRAAWGQRNTIPALDGRSIYVGQDYQCLNYLLQACEAVTCKAAVSWAMDKIKEEGLRAEPRLFYHDEQQWVAHEDDAQRVSEILASSFKHGPEVFGVSIMDGEAKIGKNLSETH